MRLTRPSPTIVVACLALFVALGGTAIATSRYVITSTSQIMPNVRSALAGSAPNVRILGPEASIKPGQSGDPLANCPTGDHIVTGGYAGHLSPGALVDIDGPRGTLGWSLRIDNTHGSEVTTLRAQALCAPGQIASVGRSDG